MKKLSVGILCFLFLAITNVGVAEVIEKHSVANITIKDYVLVSLSQEYDFLNRSLLLKVQNTGEETLYNVEATLIHISNEATVNEEVVFLGTITAGQTIISSNVFNCSVDVSKISDGKLYYTWQIEYDDANGNHFVDEGLVEEIINGI